MAAPSNDTPSRARSSAVPENELPEQLKTRKKIWTFWIGLTFLAISIISGTLIGWELKVKDFTGNGVIIPGFQGRTLNLVMNIISIDASAATITIIYQISNDSCHGENCSDVNIFCDWNLETDGLASNIPPSTDRQTTPLFRWSPSIYYNDVYSSYPIFKTKSLVVGAGLQSPDLQQYPFDRYVAPISMYALEAGTNVSVGFSIAHAAGVTVGFKLTSELRSGSDTVPGQISSNVLISRGSLVKAYAIIINIAVWVITLIFVHSTLYSIVGGYPQPTELLVIPVATLFTVTQLRSTMPGAPNGFGAIIDYVALLPCLALMTICGSIGIALLAFSDPTKPRRSLLDKFLAARSSKDAGKQIELPITTKV